MSAVPVGRLEQLRGVPAIRLDAAMVRSICDNIENGAFIWIACAAAGISYDTYNRWVLRGQRGEEPYADFVRQIEVAYAKARQMAEQTVFAGNSLAWLMKGPGRERNGREGWSDQKEVVGSGGGPVRFTIKVGERAPAGATTGQIPETPKPEDEATWGPELIMDMQEHGLLTDGD